VLAWRRLLLSVLPSGGRVVSSVELQLLEFAPRRDFLSNRTFDGPFAMTVNKKARPSLRGAGWKNKANKDLPAH
jgi:hypothetical protein